MTTPPDADVLEVENADQALIEEDGAVLLSEKGCEPVPSRRQRKGSKPPAPELCEKTNTIWI
jgi:hypothetical protein